MEKQIKLAVLVAVNAPKSRPEENEEHLDELAFLAETIGIIAIERFPQKLPNPDVRTFVGKGKLEEIKNFISSNKVRYVLFDDDLSPSQLRNLEKELNKAGEEPTVRIYDRSLLILDIFFH